MRKASSYFKLTAIPVIAVIIVLSSDRCSTQKKLFNMKRQAPSAQIDIPAEDVNFNRPSPEEPGDTLRKDTLIIKTLDGHKVTVMRAIRDDDGNMVANQVLEAAKVTARFRNVAERHGKVDLEFQITVPAGIRDSRWQLRYQPTMFILGDSTRLDKVMVTGKDYRKKQLRGYQQYQRFLDRIISDSTRFIRLEALEIFLKRNIPQIYAFRCDSSIVSDEQFLSAFGVSQREAISHYTDKMAVERNEMRKKKKGMMFRKYVKSPLESEGIRLDTVMVNENGDYVYNYIQTIQTRAGLKKADIVLDGEIYEQDRKLCDIGRSKELNFYISSVSAFVDDSERYVTRIIERRATESASYRIEFKTGSHILDLGLGRNAEQIAEIKSNVTALMTDSIFELDSLTVTAYASPEGNSAANSRLSGNRSESIRSFFSKFVRHVSDSLRRESGFFISVDDSGKGKSVRQSPYSLSVVLNARHLGEDWPGLAMLIDEDNALTDSDREEFKKLYQTCSDEDLREKSMSRLLWYGHVRNELYPCLRRVDFDFHLHRKAMVKDTIHTTELDTLYMAGVKAIKDRDYDKAIEILRPYNDYNTAVAYCAKDFNHSALSILRKCRKDAKVNYMLALIYSRLGDERLAVEHYLRSCEQDGRYVHRGNLDPEISRLVKTYSLSRP